MAWGRRGTRTKRSQKRNRLAGPVGTQKSFGHAENRQGDCQWPPVDTSLVVLLNRTSSPGTVVPKSPGGPWGHEESLNGGRGYCPTMMLEDEEPALETDSLGMLILRARAEISSELDSAFVNAQSSNSNMTDDPDRPESTSTNTSAELHADLFGPCLQCCASALGGKLSVYGLPASQVVSTKSPSSLI
ncbi:hypothetical protein HZ326_21847 [Fusarium oxysporum f. sp. albedinis]|nr:hypothetical protein HZ326_23725 [Fusarium oxysporum f. sp. albedinis]KAJ0135120.1 hypothetical protein HZ326_21847 [Fusarium oxysporum f. sp. albedinis]